MELQEAKARIDALQRKEIAYNHAMGLLSYDGATGAPAGTAANRGETLAMLSEASYGIATGPEMIETVETLLRHADELDEVTRRIAFLEGRYAAPFNGFICGSEQTPDYSVWALRAP